MLITMPKTFTWFESLKELWIKKDIDSIQYLFADDINYYEDEDSEALASWNDIKKVWEEIRTQNIHKVQNTSVTGDDRIGTCHCDLEFTDRQNKRFSYKCILNVALNDQGKATEFRQTCVEVASV